MNKKKSVLGRGLGSILRNPETDITSKSESKNNVVGNISNIKITEITTNPFQPRRKFDPEKIEELSHSIDKLGVIQPITVRKLGNDKYQLISGERRLRAAKMAGKIDIPVYIRIANDQQMLEMALVENIQRSNLNPIEVAYSFQRLMNECRLTQEECSERVGKKRSTVANFLRLLKLPEDIQTALKNEKISMGHARALINIKNKESQISLCNDIIAYGFSVREVEQMAKSFIETGYKQTSKTRKTKIPTTLPFSLQQDLHIFRKNLENKIEVKRNNKGKGKMIISFNSDEDFSDLINKLNKS